MPTAKSAGRSGARWRAAVAQLKREAPPICHYCGEAIDQSLHYLHPQAWQADHVPPLPVLVARGDDPDDVQWLKPAHRRCNIIAGNKKSPTPVVASKRW